MKKSINEKSKRVEELIKKINNSKTLMIVSIKNLPSRQFQDIKKSLRKEVLIKVDKKNIFLRVIKGLKKESALPLEKYAQENCAFAISNIEGFKLAGLFIKNRIPVFAKSGQIAQEDIEVKEGQTDLVPGPAISELGSFGIQISVENGKIFIKAPKVVVKKGEVITEGVASLLQKLNIQPFKVGIEPLVIYDVEKEKIYDNIEIDSEKTLNNLKMLILKAVSFSQRIGYYCKDNIGYFLNRAYREAKILETKLMKN